MKKAYIQTYGCQMNEHDTYRMAGLLVAEGYTMTDDVNDANLVLVNTCSVRHNPENKVYSQLGRLRDLKKTRDDLIIGVGGCVAQQEGEAILKREKTVDMVFGPDNLFKLPEMIERVQNGERVLMTKWQPHERRVHNFIPEEWVEKGHVEGCKAYISITKGCDNFCTFCVVPYTRGREVSREPDNILLEARDLARRGAKEIWLLGQNVNSYSAKGHGFYRLLQDLVTVDELERIRFTSPHPNDWNNELSDLMVSEKKICNQLHIPFQAGSSRMLKKMKRGHTLEEYLDKIHYMQSVNPTLELSTDIIVGFPTETEDEFQQTLDVVREAHFSQIFPFKYSPRPKTKAAQMPDNVSREVKEDRLARLIALQKELHEVDIQKLVGTRQTVLIDSASVREQDTMSGRTDGYRPVSIKSTDLDIGDLVDVTIQSASGHWLYGEPIEEPATV
ncbi:MAG: tRNA (N6-isopentenyl adenosine(37)-C2)-methylthiotransferase MiaB [Candidatus Hydrogenedentota bacterium]